MIIDNNNNKPSTDEDELILMDVLIKVSHITVRRAMILFIANKCDSAFLNQNNMDADYRKDSKTCLHNNDNHNNSDG